MDVTVPMNCLNAQDLDNMIPKMRDEGLSDCSINSYTRTLKAFFSWCNEEGHSDLNIKLYKAAETVKFAHHQCIPFLKDCQKHQKLWAFHGLSRECLLDDLLAAILLQCGNLIL